MSRRYKYLIKILLLLLFFSFSINSFSDRGSVKKGIKTEQLTESEKERLEKYDKEKKEREKEADKIQTEIDNAHGVKLKPTSKIAFDDLSDEYVRKINDIFESGKWKEFSFSLLVIFASIQLAFDSIWIYAAGKNQVDLVKALARRLLQFGMYVFSIIMILNGTIIKETINVSYGIVSVFIGSDELVSLDSLWNYSQSLIADLFQGIYNSIYIDVKHPIKTLKSLPPTLLLIFCILIMIFMILHAFLLVMAELFVQLISIVVALTLSCILIPLGVLDGTREFYSVSKIISLVVNFIIKLSSLNLIAIISIKALQKTDIPAILAAISQDGVDLSELFRSDFMVFCLCVWIVVDLVKRIDISF